MTPFGQTATLSYDEDTSSQKYSGRRAPHHIRVPFQRRHAFFSLDVPDLHSFCSSKVSPITRNDAPPVRKHRNALNLRRRHITTKVLQIADAATHFVRVPFQRRHAFAGLDVPHLEHSWRLPTLPVTRRARNDAPPVRKHCNALDLQRRHITTTVLQIVDAAMHVFRVPFQRRHASTGRHVPHLERLVARRRHDAPPVRKHRNALDLQRRHITTTVLQNADAASRTASECPSSVATHLPVATSQTLSVSSLDADTTRRPSGNTATLKTYDEDTSSQKYSGRRNARSTSALPASPRIRGSPRPTP